MLRFKELGFRLNGYPKQFFNEMIRDIIICGIIIQSLLLNRDQGISEVFDEENYKIPASSFLCRLVPYRGAPLPIKLSFPGSRSAPEASPA
jgi:hypothetical protein